MPSYNVTTWNVGKDGDYYAVAERHASRSWKAVDELPTIRDALFKTIFSSLSEDRPPQLFCLQEIGGNKERAQQWLGEQFQLEFDGYDATIAWNRNQFDLIPDSLLSKSHCASYIMGDLVDRGTGAIVRLASAHIKGFDLANPNERDGSGFAYDAGDMELQEVVDQIFDKKRPATDLRILGMDANSTPDIHPQRLKIAETKGLSRLKDSSFTAYNPTLATRRAKLDYIFAKAKDGFQAEIVPGKLDGWVALEKPEQNPSDHRPVCRTIQIKRKKRFFW